MLVPVRLIPILLSTVLTAFAKTPQDVLEKTPEATLAELKRQPLSNETEIVLTSDPVYTKDFTQRWTTYGPAKPDFSIAAKPGTIEDVQKIVKYAVANNVSLFTTGGGNSYSTSLSRLQNSLNVDLGNFRSVSVDREESTMTVGGAVTFGKTYDPLHQAGKQFLSTGTSNPGVVGVTLGVGIGPLMGKYGFMIDSLLSVQMVTGAGEILTASKTENPELFWGMRGAGFNFGIVLSATYRVYDYLNEGKVYNADLMLKGESRDAVFNILSKYEESQDERLSLNIKTAVMDNTTPVIMLSAIYFGPKEEGDAAIKPFIDLDPIQSNISEVHSNKLVDTANFGGNKFAIMKGRSADLWGYNLNTLSVETLNSIYNKFTTFLMENPTRSSDSFWQLEIFPREVATSIPEESTAYPWRKTVAYGFFEFHPNDETEETRNIIDDFCKQLREEITTGCGNAERNILVNYARGDETPEQMYGAANLPKLRDLKARYDPQNLFCGYNPV